MWENLRPIIGGIRADVTWIKVFVTMGVPCCRPGWDKKEAKPENVMTTIKRDTYA